MESPGVVALCTPCEGKGPFVNWSPFFRCALHSHLRCPVCRKDVAKEDVIYLPGSVKPSEGTAEEGEQLVDLEAQWRASTKIERVLNELSEIHAWNKKTQAKALVAKRAAVAITIDDDSEEEEEKEKGSRNGGRSGGGGAGAGRSNDDFEHECASEDDLDQPPSKKRATESPAIETPDLRYVSCWVAEG